MSRYSFIALMGLGALAVHAQQPLTTERVRHVTATIEAVNDEGRALVMRGADNSRLLVIAGPEVRNFEQISAGDRVSARYREAIAMELLPRGSAAKPSKSYTAKRAPEGQRPALALSNVISTTVTIESVDTSFQTVTFKRADGIVRTAAVGSPRAKELIRGLRCGDQVLITYSEAVALDLKAAG